MALSLSELYDAAVHKKPLKEELDPVRGVLFEMLQGPTNAPLQWGLIFAAIVIMGFAGVTRLSVPTRIQIVAEPQGAEVVVDGVVRGTAPLMLKDLPRGRHTVEVRQAEFQTKVLTVDVGAFSPKKYTATLAVVPPKAVEPVEKQQTLAQIFATKATEKAPPPGKRAAGKGLAKPGVRLAAR